MKIKIVQKLDRLGINIIISIIICSILASGALAQEAKIDVHTNRYVVLDDPNGLSSAAPGFFKPTDVRGGDWGSSYWSGESTTIRATALVTDNNGTPTSGVNVDFNIRYPNGTIVASSSSMTDSRGIAYYSFNLNERKYWGYWKIDALANVGGTDIQDSASFVLNWWGCTQCHGNQNPGTWGTMYTPKSYYTTGYDFHRSQQKDKHTDAMAKGACIICHQSYNGTAVDWNFNDNAPTINPDNEYSHDWHNGKKKCQDCHQGSDISITPQGKNPEIAGCYDTNGCHAQKNTNLTNINSTTGYVVGGSYRTNYSDIQNSNVAKAHNDTRVECINCHGAGHNISKPYNTSSTSNTYTENEQCWTCHTDRLATHYSDSNCVNCHSQDAHKIGKGGGPNCLSCHNTGGSATHEVDGNTITQGIHANLNSGTVADPGLEENKKCWGCHQNFGTQPTGMGDRYKNPYKCYDCHMAGSPVPNVPIVDEHFKSGIDIKAATMAIDNSLSCILCHNLPEMKLSYIDNEFTDFSLVSHYGKNRGDLRVNTGSAISTNCYYCHQNTTTVFSNAMINTGNNYIPNHSSAPNTPKCTNCHNEGKIHDSQLVKNKLTSQGQPVTKLTTKSLSNDNDIIKILSLSDTLESSLSKTDKMSRSFSNVATSNPEIFSIQTSSSYSGATNACISCHNDTTYPEDTDGNGIAAPYKRPHNDSVWCEYCHGSNPHSVKYIQPDGSLGTSRETAATCIDCHQTGTVPANNANFSTAYVIGNQLHHSNDPNNGSLWTRSGEDPFWTNQSTACQYCHGETKHNITALGKPSGFNGPNTVRTWGTWCGSCHYNLNSEYNNMLGIMGIGKIPPEITGDTNYGNYVSHVPTYYDHSSIPNFLDTACTGCHGSKPNVSAMMHDTSSGQGGPNCVSCHDVNANGAPYLVNVSTMGEGVHKDLNKDAATSLDARNKKCWACHGDGNQPIQHPTTYKTPATCVDCHAGSNRNFTPNDTILTVSEHYLNGDQIRTPGALSCYKCHNKSEMMIFANDPDSGSGAVYGGANGGNNSTSHYGKKRGDLDAIKDTKQYCSYCHIDTPPPDSFFDVFIDVYNTDIQNHSRYGTNPACQDCHSTGRIHNATLNFSELTLPNSTICLDCHGPDGTASIKNKSKHNNTVECSVCHLETGKDIHPVKYLNNTGGFSLNKNQGVNCTDCHESGNYGAPAIGKLQHSENTYNGSLWSIGAGRPSEFWDNNSLGTACSYCHGDTKHNMTALGRLNGIKGTNVVNVFGTWCGICHYQSNSQFGSMIGVFSGIGVPPEISRHATYGNYPSGARDGTLYFNHSLTTYADTRCDDCHYSGTPPNLTKSVHNVLTGGSSCLGCHAGVDVDLAKMGKHANVSKIGSGVTDDDCKGCHFNVLTLGQMVDGYANFSNTYYCQDCHAPGGRNVAQYNNITNVTLRKSVMPPGHAQGNCTACHVLDGENYHPNGPLGVAAGKNCYSCHYRSDGVGTTPNAANVGLNDTFRAPGEDHVCNSCHDTIDRPPLTGTNSCGKCHGGYTLTNNHYVQYGSHGDQVLTLSGVTVDTPVSAGTFANVTGTISNEYVQVAKAQYRIMNSAGTVVIRDWAAMDATDGKYNERYEPVKGRIDTNGLSGIYKVQVRGMISGYWATGGSGHNAALPYYPNNGLWTSTTTVTMNVTGGTMTWAGWTWTGGTSTIGPSITEFNSNLSAIGVGMDHNIYINSMNTAGIWSGWIGTGGTSNVGASIATFNGRLYAIGVGMDNGIYVNSMSTGGVWSGWSWTGGTSTISPSIAAFNGKLYAIGVGMDGGIYINSMDTSGTWAGWSWTGGTSTISPSIAAFNGKLYAIGVGMDNNIYVNSMDTSGTWAGWASVSMLSNAAASIAAFNGRLYAMAVGTDHNIYINSMDISGIWSGWTSVSMSSNVATSIATFNSKLYAMAVGTDNKIYINNLS